MRNIKTGFTQKDVVLVLSHVFVTYIVVRSVLGSNLTSVSSFYQYKYKKAVRIRINRLHYEYLLNLLAYIGTNYYLKIILGLRRQALSFW